MVGGEDSSRRVEEEEGRRCSIDAGVGVAEGEESGEDVQRGELETEVRDVGRNFSISGIVYWLLSEYAR